MKPALQDIKATTALKGVAILAVILIHILSSIHHAYIPAHFPLVAILDQVARFCVPLFMALSGYALMKKYEASLPVVLFFRKRILRLIPLYILWSGIFAITLSGGFAQFFEHLFYGQADYQLYFVPMIIQLYLLFPVLRSCLKRWPLITLFGALFVQLIAYQLDVNAIHMYQYWFSFSWIFYFVLGMWIAIHPRIVRRRASLVVFATVMCIGLLSALYGSLHSYAQGVDPIDAFRFTRLPILVYTTGFVSLCIGLRIEIYKVLQRAWGFFDVVGEQSFLIYLSHTLPLRVVFALLYGNATMASAVPMTLLCIVGLLVSRYL